MDDALRVREFWFGKSLTGALPGQGELASQAVLLKRRVDLWFETNPKVVGQQDEIVRAQFRASWNVQSKVSWMAGLTVRAVGSVSLSCSINFLGRFTVVRRRRLPTILQRWRLLFQ